MRKAQLLQGPINRVVRHREAEFLVQTHDQVASAPAHHTVDRRDRSFLHQTDEKRFVLFGELAGRTRCGLVDQTVWSPFVEPDHPVPQRLTIHAANLRRLLPRGAVEHGRNR